MNKRLLVDLSKTGRYLFDGILIRKYYMLSCFLGGDKIIDTGGECICAWSMTDNAQMLVNFNEIKPLKEKIDKNAIML